MTQPSTNSEIAAAYNDWAETYDTVQNLTRDLAAKALQQADLNFAGSLIVEVGCGTGRNTDWLARPDAGASAIVALDFSEEMLKKATDRVRDPRVQFVQQDVRTTWPLSSSTADIVVVTLVLEHVEHLEPIFCEAARTLKDGGEIFICELHPARQLMGKQARFTNSKTGENTFVTAFPHTTENYLQAGASADFELIHAVDYFDTEAPPDDLPRILSLHFHLR